LFIPTSSRPAKQQEQAPMAAPEANNETPSSIAHPKDGRELKERAEGTELT
jgi:hypothetical protein